MVDTLITLYEDSESEFETQGLGSLIDATSCTVREERNGEFELTMQYPITGQHFSDIILRRIIFAKPNPYDSPQPFRIYGISRPLNGIITVNAHHLSYDLSGYSISPFEAPDSTAVFIELNSQMNASWNQNKHPFTFFTDKDMIQTSLNLVTPCNARSLLGGSENTILDLYKGEYSWDKWNVTLHKNRGLDRGVSIRYGKNLTDLEQEENCDNVWTGVYPYWYSQDEENGGLVQLTEKIVYAQGEYKHERIMILDLSSEFEDIPSEGQLRDAAIQYMEDNDIGKPTVSLTVSFINLPDSEEYQEYKMLQIVRLCDTVTISFPKMNVDSSAKCIATTYNVLTGKYDSIELGDAKSNLASTIADQGNTMRDEIDKNNSDLQRAIENATKLITGGLGGYVVLHASDGGKFPDEILIMDSPNIEDAKCVWRWNKNGLGYSSTGYMGPFGLAMTMDGAIVANYVTSGELNGGIIKAGSILAKSLLVEYTDATSEVSPNGIARYAQQAYLLTCLDAIDFRSLATSCAEDGVITEEEHNMLATLYNDILVKFRASETAFNDLYSSAFLPNDLKPTLAAEKSAYVSAYNALEPTMRGIVNYSEGEDLASLVNSLSSAYDSYKVRYDALQETLENSNSESIMSQMSVEARKELTDLGLASAQADGTLRAIVADNIISEAEKRSINKLLQQLEKEFKEADDATQRLLTSVNPETYQSDLTEEQKSGLRTEWNSFNIAYSRLHNSVNNLGLIDQILALNPGNYPTSDGTTYQTALQSLVSSYNTAYEQYKTAYAGLMVALQTNTTDRYMSRLNVTKEGIFATVSSTYATNEYLNSQINIVSGQISSKVSAADFSGYASSYVSQNLKNILIEFNTYSIEGGSSSSRMVFGDATVYGGSTDSGNIYDGASTEGITLFSDDRFADLYDSSGVITQPPVYGYLDRRIVFNGRGLTLYYEGKTVGRIGQTYYSANSSQRGIFFGLHNGAFMSWGILDRVDNDGNVFYKTVLRYARDGMHGEPSNSNTKNGVIRASVPFYQSGNAISSASLVDARANGYATVDNRKLSVITDISIDEDGNLTWDKAEINIRSGMITSVPQDTPIIEEESE